jgi:hypothetical protein
MKYFADAPSLTLLSTFKSTSFVDRTQRLLKKNSHLSFHDIKLFFVLKKERCVRLG